jgi:hypothetical protein
MEKSRPMSATENFRKLEPPLNLDLPENREPPQNFHRSPSGIGMI